MKNNLFKHVLKCYLNFTCGKIYPSETKQGYILTKQQKMIDAAIHTTANCHAEARKCRGQMMHINPKDIKEKLTVVIQDNAMDCENDILIMSGDEVVCVMAEQDKHSYATAVFIVDCVNAQLFNGEAS